jgi:pimeloyl-ACP methyl ester carboxylesterase
MPNKHIKDLDIFYEKMGIGDPIIFLHSGYSRGILAFASQMLDFQRKYTCYFPDFRGHGRTKCNSLEWNTPQLAEDIIDYMDGMQITKAHFIGYSLGATVGMYCAANHPHRVATLTTIGASGFADPSGADEFEPEWLIENGNHEMINQMIERHQDAHQGDWQEFMQQSAKDWRLYPQLTEEQLRSIKCPALFISGENDPFVGEEKLRILSSFVEGSQYLSVPGGSHRPHMLRESPVFVNDRILEFLNSNSM